MHKSAETVTVQFCVSDPATGGLVDADALPTGALVLNGVDNAAVVTVTNLATGRYRASLTLPTLTNGDELQLRIAATVGGVTGAGIVWSGYGVTARPADVAAAVWAYATRTLTQTSAQVTDALEGEDLTIHRGDTYNATLTGLSDLAGRKKLVFTAKKIPISDADTAAVIQITEAGGLLWLNGAAYATVAHGSLTVGGGGDSVAIMIHGIATAQLAVGKIWSYDLQVISATDDPITVAVGKLNVESDVTRATA